MNKALTILLLCAMLPAAPAYAEDESGDIHRIQVRVIFADTTGQFGTVPKDLGDMRITLTKYFDYPSFTLSNTIRLSTFGDEEAVAMVFPDHYLKITPKGAAGEALKAKVEIFHQPPEERGRARIYSGDREDLPVVRLDENGKKKGTDLPIVSSAMALNDDDWEAFGGVPVRVTGSGTVNGNTLSSGGLSSSLNPSPTGRLRYLIIAVKLED